RRYCTARAGREAARSCRPGQARWQRARRTSAVGSHQAYARSGADRLAGVSEARVRPRLGTALDQDWRIMMGDSVSDFLLRRLHAWGVRRIFGYPGDGINGIMGALGRIQKSG